MPVVAVGNLIALRIIDRLFDFALLARKKNVYPCDPPQALPEFDGT
jgi:hypothetical protein